MKMSGLLARLKRTDLRKAMRIGFVIAGVGFGVFLGLAGAGVRINTSPSLPIGLYISTPDNGYNLIEFCPVEPFASFATGRGYRSQGRCPDGATPLLKPVVAVPGDIVELSVGGLSVNGTALPNTRPSATDSFGRVMPIWPFGVYAVAPGTVWVASSHHPRSFDSRYFGSIQISAIRERLRPLLTE
jgi:conjugative transfer signal peptidase TraF